MKQRVLLIAAALTLACGEELKPETLVEDLRVLSVVAEPAELRPGETASLKALIVDPSRPGEGNTALWLSCDPDPLDLGRSACSRLDQFSDPSALFAPGDGGTPELPPGMKLAGFGDQALYTAPADLFSNLAEDDPVRRSGTVAQLLLLAVAEEVSPTATPEELEAVMERVRTKETASVIAIYRIRVTEQTPTNQNPRPFSLVVDGQAVPEGGHVLLREGEDHQVEVTAPPEAVERFVQLTPDGEVEQTERLIAAPYSTSGRFFLSRLTVNEGVRVAFTAPGEDGPDPLPSPGRGRIWVVVRDTRGGQAWREHRMHFCAGSGAAPSVSSAELTDGVLRLEGQRLDQVVDVVVEDQALREAGYSEVTGRFEGVLPPLPAGTYPVRLVTRSCETVASGQEVVVP